MYIHHLNKMLSNENVCAGFLKFQVYILLREESMAEVAVGIDLGTSYVSKMGEDEPIIHASFCDA
jgi:hypothetical protein